MNIATQLHREQPDLDALYRKAKLYCDEQRIQEFRSKEIFLKFTFSDNSKLHMIRAATGQFTYASAFEG